MSKAYLIKDDDEYGVRNRTIIGPFKNADIADQFGKMMNLDKHYNGYDIVCDETSDDPIDYINVRFDDLGADERPSFMKHVSEVFGDDVVEKVTAREAGRNGV